LLQFETWSGLSIDQLSCFIAAACYEQD